MLLGSFDYARYFPNSKRAKQFGSINQRKIEGFVGTPSFSDFTETWLVEMSAQWRNSYTKSPKAHTPPKENPRPAQLIQRCK